MVQTMNKSSLIVLLFCLIPTVVLAQNAPVNPAIDKMSELAWHVGTWHQQGTWLPNGEDISGIINCGWVLEKTAIKCDLSLMDSPERVSDFYIISYDAALSHYPVTRFSSMMASPMHSSMAKKMDGWTMEGESVMPNLKVWDQMVLTPNGDTITLVQFRSMNDGDVQRVQEGTLTRM